MVAASQLQATWTLFHVLARTLVVQCVMAESRISARDVIWEFSQGNVKFVEGRRDNEAGHKQRFHHGTLIDKLVEDPLKPVQRKAIILSDARGFAPIDEILNTAPGEIQIVRVCGYVCGRHDPYDGVIGSVEFALNQSVPPPLMLVLGNSGNVVVEAAVRIALVNSSHQVKEHVSLQTTVDTNEEEFDIVQEVLPSARDALLQDPHASFEELCDIAAKLNVWNTIETLLTTSVAIYDLVLAGLLQVHGGLYNIDTGKVQFMGEHPSQYLLLEARPTDIIVRTAKAPPVPAQEAIAMLHAGNKRYAKGNGGSARFSADRGEQLSEGGQNPFAVILGCADSRAPPEILFDAHPGDIFVLRTAGNTCRQGPSSIVGSAEYAIGHLRTKLIVIMGHTKCGAVSAAVDAVRTNKSLDSVPGSIGQVLAPLRRQAAKAVLESPEGIIIEQVSRATELNVFATIAKFIKSSPLIANGIRKMDLEVHGAIYDIESGEIQWLGQHPSLPRLLGSPLPFHMWKVAPYVRARYMPDKYLALEQIEVLRKGNLRFVKGQTERPFLIFGKPDPTAKPFAIVLAGSELKVPIETVFDTGRGEVVVQRSMGSIAGHPSGTLFASLEYAVQHFSPKLLLVLGESGSHVISSALEHLDGAASSPGHVHSVLDRVAVSALRATAQTGNNIKGKAGSKVVTSAGRDMKRRRLTVELNVLYTIEKLLRYTKVIRNAVKRNELEVHAAILHEDTGKVDFIGMHPMQNELLKDAADTEINVDSASASEGDECFNPDPNHEHDYEHDHSSCDHAH